MHKMQALVSLIPDGPEGNYPERQFTLTPESPSIPIGRSSKRDTHREDSSNAFFASPVISRNHAEIFIGPDEPFLWIKDVGSMHGTSVNFEKIEMHKNHKLSSGDVVSIGCNIMHREKEYLARTFHVTFIWQPWSSPTQKHLSKNQSSALDTWSRGFQVPDSSSEDDSYYGDSDVEGQRLKEGAKLQSLGKENSRQRRTRGSVISVDSANDIPGTSAANPLLIEMDQPKKSTLSQESPEPRRRPCIRAAESEVDFDNASDQGRERSGHEDFDSADDKADEQADVFTSEVEDELSPVSSPIATPEKKKDTQATSRKDDQAAPEQKANSEEKRKASRWDQLPAETAISNEPSLMTDFPPLLEPQEAPSFWACNDFVPPTFSNIARTAPWHAHPTTSSNPVSSVPPIFEPRWASHSSVFPGNMQLGLPPQEATEYHPFYPVHGISSDKIQKEGVPTSASNGPGPEIAKLDGMRSTIFNVMNETSDVDLSLRNPDFVSDSRNYELEPEVSLCSVPHVENPVPTEATSGVSQQEIFENGEPLTSSQRARHAPSVSSRARKRRAEAVDLKNLESMEPLGKRVRMAPPPKPLKHSKRSSGVGKLLLTSAISGLVGGALAIGGLVFAPESWF